MLCVLPLADTVPETPTKVGPLNGVASLVLLHVPEEFVVIEKVLDSVARPGSKD